MTGGDGGAKRGERTELEVTASRETAGQSCTKAVKLRAGAQF